MRRLAKILCVLLTLVCIGSLFAGCGGTDVGVEGGFSFLGHNYKKLPTKLVYANDEFLGKPKDRADAERMIRMLSGSSHEVVSGIYLYLNGHEESGATATRVIFDEMSDSEIEAYLATDEPYDKAGAYAIQGKAGAYIRGIEGDYFNVVGLPVNLLKNTLKEKFNLEICKITK